ncbi:hypothetical protein SAMN04490202_3986 [Pseudomonas reinekei]|jgi:hypothetical protein|uniref:Uncharacterized protein n=1 Tax=Pseudomonas reinekei TaxID=395598 RepID=A0A1H0SAH2_PSERE|nr:hypothetical protein SAMN04490202_3986 [Pseudomonas reinekei]
MLMTVVTAYYKRFNDWKSDAETYNRETPMLVRNSLY